MVIEGNGFTRQEIFGFISSEVSKEHVDKERCVFIQFLVKVSLHFLNASCNLVSDLEDGLIRGRGGFNFGLFMFSVPSSFCP